MSIHGEQHIIGQWFVYVLDPILSLGPATTVKEMYRARRMGACPSDDCLLFNEGKGLACYRHLTCEALPAVEEFKATRQVQV